MSFKEQLKEYFTFTKGESQGITVLLMILFIAILFNLLSAYFIPDNTDNFNEFSELVTAIEADSINNQTDSLNLNSFFPFNPNNFSFSEAEQLGISKYQYEMIQKYLNSGGIFRYKSDFAKIYSIKPEQFNALKDYIDLPEKENLKETYSEKSSYKEKKINYFPFNPNTLDDSGWENLGFSKKQVSSIRKFINAGGKFYKKEDLKKLYVIDDKKYSELEVYIEIPERVKNKVVKKSYLKIDINNLSAEELKKYGKFWQYNATRIVKYRHLLGGFYKKEQLLEVYGIKKEYFDKVKDDIIINKSKLEKININFAEISELGRHPYISWEDAKKIIEYRNNNGFIKDLIILKKKQIIPEDIYEKISPYLKVK